MFSYIDDVHPHLFKAQLKLMLRENNIRNMESNLEKKVYCSTNETRKNKLNEFAEGTTMHGFRYAFGSSKHLRRRVVWLIVIVLMVCGFLATFVDSVIQYLKFESVINVKAERLHQLEMPSVSFCNSNIAKYSSILNYSPEYAQSLVAVTGIVGTLPIPHLPVPEVAKNLTWKEFHKFFGYSINDLFVACNVNGHVNCSEYVTPLADDRAYCFTFNSKEVVNRKGNITITKAGYRYGLTLFLDVSTHDYGHPLYLGEGIELVIHSPDIMPFKDGDSQYIAPGKEYFYAVKKRTVKRLPQPYSRVDCVGDEENKMALAKYNLTGLYDTYSYSSCVHNCKMQAISRCGCSYEGGNLPECTMFLAQTCTLKESARFYNSGEDCGCLPTCTNVLYETQASSLNFPNTLMEKFLPYLNWTVDTVDEMKKRYIQLHIYFGTMEVEESDQIPLVSLVQLLSSFGGLMGLYMGASIVTVIEFFDILLCTVCEKCKKKNIKKTKTEVIDLQIKNGGD